jgi:hypothetical protein
MESKMRNRYGDEYTFESVDENTYTIKGDLKYWRFGGREGQEQMDLSDLGFVDPSGGPFIEVGMKIEGREIVNISAADDLDSEPKILFGVK